MTPLQAIAQAQGLVGHIDPRGFFMHADVRKEGDDLEEVRRQAVAAEAVMILLSDHASGRLAWLRASCALRAKQAAYSGQTILGSVEAALAYWRQKGGPV